MDVSKETRTRIKENLSKIESAKDIFELFKALNYPENVVFDITAKRKKDSFEFRSDNEQRVKEIYSVLSLENKIHIFLLETTSIAPSFIRSVTTTFDRQYLNFLLILTVDYSEVVFIFPNREKINEDQHKLKLIKLIVNRNEIYYTDVQTLSNLLYEKGTTRRQLWKQWRSAFSVERVTKNFFDDYKKVFFLLKKELSTQGIPKKESHEFTLQLLNRIMFVYFISKKEGWLNTKRFMKWLWESYKKQGKYGDDEFYEVWLKQVFFKAFNNQSNLITDLPIEVKNEISNFPFLNGGLFTSNDLDILDIEISDELYEKIYKFYKKYNFTIKEDMPFEEEVAVDPQMIGYVYESLANVAEEIYDRNDLGIFYTPRVEVDFIARRALTEYLSKNLDEIPKEKLYHLVFDTHEEKKKIIKDSDDKFWYRFEEILDNLSAVDPACGSGAFLVGLLNVLTELYHVIYQQLNRNATDFELKKRIIQYSLYGVDIMPWAIHAAELRLWLQLMVETELKTEELRNYPLLPNLDLNLRIGDSLVQEIGGLFFNLRTSDLQPAIKRKLSSLKDEKRNYFDNLPRAKFKSPEEVKEEELRLFEEIIESRIKILSNEINQLKINIKKVKSQQDIYGKPVYDEKKVSNLENKINENKTIIDKLNEIKNVIDIPEKRPFVWDIDFAEIFGEKNGFDIVIGNPPYVRQEDIAPFNKIKSEVTEDEKKNYKAKLMASVKHLFPVVKKIDGKSDYYIYFYFHGLSLLNENGIFCFITSNSWLDVEYGKDLQEFLLKYVPIIAIYDNPQRIFEHADVSAVIVLLGTPTIKEKKIAGLRVLGKKSWSMLNHTTKFVMFKKPFEEVVNTDNLLEIEQVEVRLRGKQILELTDNLIHKPNYRIFPITQGDLLNDGWDYPKNYDFGDGRFLEGSYAGNKWGGKFLRARDIYFKILEKGKDKLIQLKDLAEIKRGFTTGANKFFYLDEDLINDWNIDDEYLLPIFKSPKESNSVLINYSELNKYVFNCEKQRDELDGNTLAYIEWGEEKEFNERPSFRARNPWYKIKIIDYPIVYPSTYNPVFKIFYNPKRCYIDKVLYGINYDNPLTLLVSLNSYLFCLQTETLGYALMGGGGLFVTVADLKKMYVLNPKFITNEIVNYFRDSYMNTIRPRIFEEVGIDPDRPFAEQVPNPIDIRRNLDNYIFNELNLTTEEINDIYLSICELVKQRLERIKKK